MTTEQTTHSIQWFGRIEPCPEFPEGLVPRTSMMQGRDWGWDVRCSCGWESRTGGAIQARLREMVAFHRYEIRNP